MGLPGLSQAEILSSIEMFGKEVLPLIEKCFGLAGGAPPEGPRRKPKPCDKRLLKLRRRSGLSS
jgi:hypothetical protein